MGNSPDDFDRDLHHVPSELVLRLGWVQGCAESMLACFVHHVGYAPIPLDAEIPGLIHAHCFDVRTAVGCARREVPWLQVELLQCSSEHLPK